MNASESDPARSSSRSVRSLVERNDAGRTVDTGAVHDRIEAAEAARKHVHRRTNDRGLLARLRGRRES